MIPWRKLALKLLLLKQTYITIEMKGLKLIWHALKPTFTLGLIRVSVCFNFLDVKLLPEMPG